MARYVVPVLATDADGRFGIGGFATTRFTSVLFIAPFHAVRVTTFAPLIFAPNLTGHRLPFWNCPHRTHCSDGRCIPKLSFKTCSCRRPLRLRSHRVWGFRIFALCSNPTWHQNLPAGRAASGVRQPLYIPPVAELGLRLRQRKSLTLEVACVSSSKAGGPDGFERQNSHRCNVSALRYRHRDP